MTRPLALVTGGMRRLGAVIAREQILNTVWSVNADPLTNIVEVYIGRLRRKLDPDGVHQPIETPRGRGYRFGLERRAG